MRSTSSLRFSILLLLHLPVAHDLAAEKLKVRPDSLDLGVVAVGSHTQAAVALVNRSDESLTVRLSTGEPFSLAVDTLTLPGKSEQSVAVGFSVADPGVYRGRVSVAVDKLFGSQDLFVALSASAARPQLLTDPLMLDFDSLAVGRQVRRTLVLRNTGPVPLRIDSLHMASRGKGSFTARPPERLTFGPGASGEVIVEFAPVVDGLVRDRLLIACADLEPQRLEIEVRGMGLAPELAVSPLAEVGIDFAEVEVGQRRTLPVTLLNRGRSDLAVTGFAAHGESFSVAGADSFVVAPGARHTLDVEFRPLHRGLASGELSITARDPERPQVILPLMGVAVVSPAEIVVLSDATIDMGSVAIGKTSRTPLLLWNRGGSPFTVDLELRERGDEFGLETTSYLLQPNQSTSIELTFSPREVGVRGTQLSIATHSGPVEYEVTGTGRYLKLSPTTEDFGRVPVGETNTAVVELTNIGNADFTVARVLTTSDDFTVYTQVSQGNEFLLAANSLRSLPVNVTFTPSTRGLRTGALRLEGFWEEGTEAFEVLLNGTGVAAEIELHPSGPLDFGFVVMGETETRTLVATNTGDTSLHVAANALNREAAVEPAEFALLPGESTKLQVVFSPESLGERFAQILLVSNDVRDKAQSIKIKGVGALRSIDLTQIATVTASRRSLVQPLPVWWTGTPVVITDGTRIDLAFDMPDSLLPALVGRQFEIDWVELDAGYGPVGAAKQLKVHIYDDDKRLIPVDELNLRLEDDGLKRVRLKVTTRSHPGAPPQTISQVFEAGGWKWEFEAKPLVSFLTIRPGRDYTDGDGNVVQGETERLIGLPGLAFAGWHNSESPSVSGVHLTAIGNVLEALSTDNAIAVSLGLAVSLYKDRFLFGFGWDIYDSRPEAKERATQDYIMTMKYSGLF